MSRWEYFDDDGSLARIEEDTDGDGKVDKWETYKDGALSMMALDTQGHGKPDRRLIYLPNGTLDRIETDPTGSGQFSTAPSMSTTTMTSTALLVAGRSEHHELEALLRSMGFQPLLVAGPDELPRAREIRSRSV